MNRYPFPFPAVLWIVNGRERKKNQTEQKKRSFNFTLKKTSFFNINIRNKFMTGISWLVSHEVCIHIQYFFGVVRNKLQTKEDQNSKERICHVNKHFPKTINQWEFDYGLFTNLPRIIVARDFSPSLLKLRRGYPISLDKVRILTWKLLVKLNSLRTYSLQNISYLSLCL